MLSIQGNEKTMKSEQRSSLSKDGSYTIEIFVRRKVSEVKWIVLQRKGRDIYILWNIKVLSGLLATFIFISKHLREKLF